MTIATDQAIFNAALREDLSAFSQKVFRTLEPGLPYEHNWHIDHINYKLERLQAGEIKRLIINVPPRSMKSILVSVAFTAWVLGKDPTKKIICTSYAEELASKPSYDTRQILQAPWLQKAFPNFALSRITKTTLDTTRRGYRLAAGMGGSILGMGADLIVVDDPIKPADALSVKERQRVNDTFHSTVMTRLNNKVDGAIVIIMQRLHEDDLVGNLLQTDDWDHVSIPAIALDDGEFRTGNGAKNTYYRRRGEVLHPEREPMHILESLKRSEGTLTFAAQYQQKPMPVAGNIVKRDWLRYYDALPKSFDKVVASWDTASTLW